MDGKRLDLYSLGTGGQLTNEYLDDRVAFDVRKIYYNKQNARYDLFAFAPNPGTNGDLVAKAYEAELTALPGRRTPAGS